MAAPDHAFGYIANALQWVRLLADDAKGVSSRYSNTQLVDLLMRSVDQVTTDIYASGDSIPKAYLTLSISAGQVDYMLPPNIGEIHRMAKINPDTGLPEWEIYPENPLHPIGPGIVFHGLTSFKLIPTPLIDTEMQITYTPNGQLRCHQNATPLYSGNGDTGTVQITSSQFKLNPRSTSWGLGLVDRRPNAYLGQVLRILGTSNDIVPPTSAIASAQFFPIQERRIESIDYYNGLLAVPAPTFDSGITWTGFQSSDKVNEGALPNEARTYFVYEVVPDVDPALLHLAAIDVARTLQVILKNSQAVALIQDEYNKKKRAAQLRWANMEARMGNRFETLTVDRDPYDWWA